MANFRFNKLPANFGQIKINRDESLIPDDIYEYAKAFRSIYIRSTPVLKKITDPKMAAQQEIKQLHGKA